MDEDESKVGPNTWRVNDLDGGATNGTLSNLHNIGATNQSTLIKNEHTPAYDMTWVLFSFTLNSHPNFFMVLCTRC